MSPQTHGISLSQYPVVSSQHDGSGSIHGGDGPIHSGSGSSGSTHGDDGPIGLHSGSGTIHNGSGSSGSTHGISGAICWNSGSVTVPPAKIARLEPSVRPHSALSHYQHNITDIGTTDRTPSVSQLRVTQTTAHPTPPNPPLTDDSSVSRQPTPTHTSVTPPLQSHSQSSGSDHPHSGSGCSGSTHDDYGPMGYTVVVALSLGLPLR